MLRFALAGNQNSGKTTLFNLLTGSNQHVGNFPGVTVDRKSGAIKGHPNTEVTDLPGIYSLSPYSSEEIVSRQFILDEKPDAIINIVDATNIDRNLYLSMQLMELDVPMVLALNMMDEVRANGGSIDINRMEAELGIPVVAISAAKNEGIEELVDHAIHVAHYQEPPLRFAATKAIEGDERVLEALQLDENEKEMLEHIIVQMEQERKLDRSAAIADMRYTFIERLCADCVVRPHESKEHERSNMIDKVLTGKWTAIPAFIGIMGLVFYLTFHVIGAFFQNLIAEGISALTVMVDGALTSAGVSASVHSLIIDGIFTGVGSVLSFIPIIVTLFFFLSLLEDSGYMARVAFVMDKLLRKIGLSGRSIVPMIIGFGCTVPAVMSTRTLPSERDRKMTILLTPFMSCSAKLPIYAYFCEAFFPAHAAVVMVLLYVIGIAVGILVALVSKNTAFKGDAVPFVMELPNYRMPTPKNTGMLMWDKTKDFLQRAFSIIFVGTIVVWFLQSFNTDLVFVTDNSTSMLAKIAGLIAPVFRPMGYGDWRICTALISGFLAKESVVSTLAVLFGSTAQLEAVLSSGSAFALLVFCLLYTPCIAAISSISREAGKKWAVGTVLFQCGIAWVMSFLTKRILAVFGIL